MQLQQEISQAVGKKEQATASLTFAGHLQQAPESSFQPAALLLSVQQHCCGQHAACQPALYLGFLG